MKKETLVERILNKKMKGKDLQLDFEDWMDLKEKNFKLINNDYQKLELPSFMEKYRNYL